MRNIEVAGKAWQGVDQQQRHGTNLAVAQHDVYLKTRFANFLSIKQGFLDLQSFFDVPHDPST